MHDDKCNIVWMHMLRLQFFKTKRSVRYSELFFLNYCHHLLNWECCIFLCILYYIISFSCYRALYQFRIDCDLIVALWRRFHLCNVRSVFLQINYVSVRTFSTWSMLHSPDQRTLFLMRPRPSISVSKTSPRYM